MKKFTALFVLLFGITLIGFIGCSEETNDQIKNDVEQAADDVKEGVEKAGDKISNEMDSLSEDLDSDDDDTLGVDDKE